MPLQKEKGMQAWIKVGMLLPYQVPDAKLFGKGQFGKGVVSFGFAPVPRDIAAKAIKVTEYLGGVLMHCYIPLQANINTLPYLCMALQKMSGFARPFFS